MDARHAATVREAVARWEGPLARYAGRILADPERGRDLAQEAFLRLCGQDPDPLEGRMAEWLFAVVRNLAVDVLRKEGRMKRLEDMDPGTEPDATAPEAGMERREASSALARAMALLPFPQQEVLRLKFQEGMSYRAISQVTGHSTGNVGFLIHAGLKALRQTA